MVKKISLQQNDNGIKILFTITKDDVVQDLTDAIIRVKFKDTTSNEEFWKTAKVVDAENGQAQCVLFRKDLAFIGALQTEVETTFPNGLRITEKNPFLPVIIEEIFNITQPIEEDIEGYQDSDLE